jgi:hypothetical protein
VHWLIVMVVFVLFSVFIVTLSLPPVYIVELFTSYLT